MENLGIKQEFDDEFDGVLDYYTEKYNRLAKKTVMSPAAICVVLLCATVHMAVFAENADADADE